MIKEFSMCGTLGDVFIVYCKLYNYWEKTRKKVSLHRYNRYVNLDKPISDFFFNIPFVEYLLPCKNVASPEEIPEEDLLAAPYINIYWDGNARGGDINDPPYIKMEPYPEVFIQPDSRADTKKLCIGIQLNCGSHLGNERSFSLRWIKKLRKILPANKYSISLFGTLTKKGSIRKTETFCLENNIENYVGKTTFLKWLSKILAVDFFITFEGFPAYFAMSQKVQSLVFFIAPSILTRIPPVWRKENIIWRIVYPLRYRLLKRNPHCASNVYPIDVDLVRNMVELRTAYV
jgi:hypothetical protein